MKWKQIMLNKKTILKVLPSTIRHRLIRSDLDLSYEFPKELTFEIARTYEELFEAFSILHDCYVQEGYMRPHPQGIRFTPYHCMPSTTTLIARWNNKIIATVSAIRDSALGLPMDSIFDLSPYRQAGQRLTEVSSLAIHPDFRKQKGYLLFPLIRYLWMYCLKYFGTDTWVIAVNPSMSDFYEALLLFKRLEKKAVEGYRFVEGAPAVGELIDLKNSSTRFSQIYRDKPKPQNLHHYLFKTSFSGEHYPDRKYFHVSDPVMTPQVLERFAVQSDLLATLNQRQFQIISTATPLPEWKEVFLKKNQDFAQSPRFSHQERLPRFDVECKTQCITRSGEILPATLRDVSWEGAKIIVPKGKNLDDIHKLRIQVSPEKKSLIEVKSVWNKRSGLAGYQIVESDSAWREFLHYLLALHSGRNFSPEKKKIAS